jgi:UDP-N-acetyl-D-glucosamine dehydrogenase
LIKYINSGSYIASNNLLDLADAKIILICVPTPLSKDGAPDLSYVQEAATGVGKYLKKGTLVIFESTVSTGTTRDILVPLLELESGLDRSDFLVAFSPERIDPLNKIWNIKNTPKLVAGLSENACDQALDFYSKFVDTVTKCESIEIAETAKLLENSFRLINISFINEISMYCSKLGIDINQVIKAASTKPYGFMPFYPSLGVGGHCIPVDPIYLSDRAKQVGAQTRFIDLADQINNQMPEYFVNKAENMLGGLEGKRVLVIGVAYKPNITDTRQTPVHALIAGLREKSALVSWHDDLVKEWHGEKSTALSGDYDLAILSTPHDYLDLSKLGDVPILNTRGSI